MARRDKNIAKTEIYGAFRKFVQSGQAKVTVSAVIEATGMNRKTFYNHFANQDELVAWGFRRDLLDSLLIHFEREDLIEPAYDPYEFEKLPCYVRIPSGTRALDQSQFFRDFRDAFRLNREYYRALFRTEFGAPLCSYLVELYRGLFIEDVEYFLNGRKMPEGEKRFIAAIYAEGVVHYMIDSFMDAIPARGNDDGGPVGNIMHEGMLHIVEAYQSEKSNLYFQDRRIV